MTQNQMNDSRVRALVLAGYGLNCDVETAYAIELAGAVSERVHINALISEEVSLSDYDIFVFDGGFSWGDYHGGQAQSFSSLFSGHRRWSIAMAL